MNTRNRVAAIAVALATAVTGAVLGPAQANAAGSIPTIRATVGNTTIRLTSHTVTSGLVRFTVVAPTARTVQLYRLRTGYTRGAFRRDLEDATMGMVDAVRRVDHGVVWAGGAEAKRFRPGRFAQRLTAGTYFLMDQNGPARTWLTVTGKARPRGGIATAGVIVGTAQERFRAPLVLPHRSWVVFKASPGEPHYLLMQRVKLGTTRADVRKFISSGAHHRPRWLRRGEAASGMISGGSRTLFHYNLPAGRYVLLCYWPSSKTGLPQADMGMYRMINLR